MGKWSRVLVIAGDILSLASAEISPPILLPPASETPVRVPEVMPSPGLEPTVISPDLLAHDSFINPGINPVVPQDSPETMETDTDNYSHQDLASLYNSDGGSALFMPSMTSDIDMSCMRPALNQSGPSASSENSLMFIYGPCKVGRPT